MLLLVARNVCNFYFVLGQLYSLHYDSGWKLVHGLNSNERLITKRCNGCPQNRKAVYKKDEERSVTQKPPFSPKPLFYKPQALLLSGMEKGWVWIFCLAKFFTFTGYAATTTKWQISDLSLFNGLQIGSLPVPFAARQKTEQREGLKERFLAWTCHVRTVKRNILLNVLCGNLAHYKSLFCTSV